MISRLRQQPRILVGLCLTVLVLAVAVVFLGDFGDDEDPAVARREAATVTESNNGGEVTVKPNQSFIVDLKGSPEAPWTLPAATTEALARVATNQDADGTAAATFLPLEGVPGATIVAERVPGCRVASPPCDTPIERFEVTVRVVG